MNEPRSLAVHEKIWIGSVIEHLLNDSAGNLPAVISTSKMRLLHWILLSNQSSFFGTSINDISLRSHTAYDTTKNTLKVLASGGYIYKDKDEKSYYIDFRKAN